MIRGEDAEDEDLRLARQLQEEENTEHMERLAEKEKRDDAALAQLLQQEYQQEAATANIYTNSQNFRSHYNAVPASRVNSSGCAHMRAGQTVDVRLKHPKTSSFIGETLRAHYLTTRGVSEIRFEVVKAPGKVMRVTDIGRVEFSECTVDDPMSRFRFELTLQGSVYLKCTAHQQKLNIAGEPGWFLAISSDGSLLGNSNRGMQAQWSLVAEQNSYGLHPSMPMPAYTGASTAAYAAAAGPRSVPTPSSAIAQPPAPAQQSGGFLRGLLGGRKSTGFETLEQEEKDYELQELNPLLFNGSMTPAGGVSTQNKPSASTTPSSPLKDKSSEKSTLALASPGSSLQKLLALPQYKDFANTLQPRLKAAVESDVVAFLRAVQSPEIWALLEAVPQDLLSSNENETSSGSAADTASASAIASTNASMEESAASTHSDQTNTDLFGDLGETGTTENVQIRSVTKRTTPARGLGFKSAAQPARLVENETAGDRNNELEL